MIKAGILFYSLVYYIILYYIKCHRFKVILKIKFQLELENLQSSIAEKAANLTAVEPSLSALLQSTKPLLAGLELDLSSLNDDIKFERFEPHLLLFI